MAPTTPNALTAPNAPTTDAPTTTDTIDDPTEVIHDPTLDPIHDPTFETIHDPSDAFARLPTASLTTASPNLTLLPADTAASPSSISPAPHSALSFPFTPGNHPSRSVGGIVGGVIGGAVFVAAGVLWVVLRRRKRRAEREDEEDMDREFERVVPGWKRGEGSSSSKGGGGAQSSKGSEKGSGTKRSTTKRSGDGHARSRRRPPKLQPITFARDPEDFDEWDSDSPTPVTRVMHLKKDGASALPPISPVSPFDGGGVGVNEVGNTLNGDANVVVPRVSVSESRARGGSVDGEDDARSLARQDERTVSSVVID